MKSFGMLSLAAILVLAVARPAPTLSAQSADALFSGAKSEAQGAHKDILLVFSASWCGPCKLYERFLEDTQMKAITETAFVIVRIDVGERASDSNHANTPGGAELRSALGAEGEPGYPFIVITDPFGNPIVNSYRNGNKQMNVGYPEAPEEIDWYIAMMRRIPSISPADLAATRAWLRQHARR